MGIGLNSAHLIARHLDKLGDLSDKKILTLGVQDCHFTYQELLAFFRRHSIPHVSLSENDIELTDGFKWLTEHERKPYKNCIHQRTFFRMLGFTWANIYAIDGSAYEGADFVHDLNRPIDTALEARFDLVFDGGTIEHVFSVKDSLFNLSRMCKLGGLVININPADNINHGFINLNAEIYRNFFGINGYDQIDLKYISFPVHPEIAKRHYIEFATKSFQSLTPFYATLVYSVVKKLKDMPLTVPNQGLYDSLWDEAGDGYQGAIGSSRKTLSSWVRASVRNIVDRHFLLCFIVRSYLTKAKGTKTLL